MNDAPAGTAATLRGLGAAGLAAVLFAVIFYLSGTLDASAEVVFGARILLTLACCAPTGRR